MNNGNGDLSGLDFGGPDVPGADIPGPSDLPGFDVPGSDIPGPADLPGFDKPGSDIPGSYPGLEGKFDFPLADYTPPPESTPSAPLTMDDLSRAFSPPAPTPAPAPAFEWPSESRFISRWEGIVREVENTLQGMIEARPEQIKDVKKAVDAIIYGLLGVIGIARPEAAPALAGIALGKGLIEKTGEKTLGQRIAESTVPEPTFAGAWERQYGFTSPVSPEITASPYSEPQPEGLSESLFSAPLTQKAPSSYPSYYGGTAYPALSMSLFGAKGNGGLMIFPTSGGAIEPEMSSLVKKQEPVIDTPSLLFLLGMGALGLVLRKAAKA